MEQSWRPSAMRNICASCLKALNRPAATPASTRPGLQNSNRIQRRHKGYIAPAGEQARPITGYYQEMLKKHHSAIQPLTRTVPAPLPNDSTPTTPKEETLEKAHLIFGSKLEGPLARRREIAKASQMIAGISVPPRPEEPENCCMSGCVNCVWDLYRDEMEEWADKSAQARAAMQAQREGGGSVPSHGATSMDDDGGGSESNWGMGGGGKESGLFDDIPVGIREFMRTEKKLKMMQKEQRERRDKGQEAAA